MNLVPRLEKNWGRGQKLPDNSRIILDSSSSLNLFRHYRRIPTHKLVKAVKDVQLRRTAQSKVLDFCNHVRKREMPFYGSLCCTVYMHVQQLRPLHRKGYSPLALYGHSTLDYAVRRLMCTVGRLRLLMRSWYLSSRKLSHSSFQSHHNPLVFERIITECLSVRQLIVQHGQLAFVYIYIYPSYCNCVG